MSAADILERVTQAGGRLILHGDKLKVRAPRPLPDDLRQAIREHKAELLQFLCAETPVPTVADFVTTCCTLEPEASVRGAALILALSRWRRVVHAADSTCTWHELATYLEQVGCNRDTEGSVTVWRGMALKADEPHTLEPSPEPVPTRQAHAPCPQCGDTERWPTTKGEVSAIPGQHLST
jgi:hypothetical protein